MNSCLHFASLEQYNITLSLNSIPLSLLTTLPPLSDCHIITFPRLWPLHLSDRCTSLTLHLTSPLPPWHLTPPIHFSHLSSSLLSHLFQLTSLPTSNRSFQNGNVLSLGRQGKYVWLTVRHPLMKAEWWDAPAPSGI